MIDAVVEETRRPWRRERATSPELLDRPEPDRTEAFGERLHLRAALRQLPAGKRGVLV